MLYMPVSTKVEEWFKTRGISQQTLTDLKDWRGPEYMPQTGKTEKYIKFNYFMGDQLSMLNIEMEERTLNYIRVLKKYSII